MATLATVILAGGSGTRLWPASCQATPKQYLAFGGAYSYLQQALLRARAVDSDLIVVVTAADQVDAVVAQNAALNAVPAPGPAAPPGTPVPPETPVPPGTPGPLYVIGEPAQRNTGPAVVLGARLAASLLDRNERDAGLLVLSADHAIDPPQAFAADVRAAQAIAQQGWLTTFGIQPTRAETGYGYLELGPPLASLQNSFKVASFREKPDSATAQRFLAAGTFLWNAGIFLFPLALLTAELELHAPALAAPLAAVKFTAPAIGPAGVGVLAPDPELNAIYAGLTGISIDYALMERSRRVATVRASFAWSDAGSWDEVAQLHPGDRPLAAIEAQRNTIFSDLPVVLAGVDDLTVVVKHGAVLVLGKGRSQLVRNAVEELRGRRPDLL